MNFLALVCQRQTMTTAALLFSLSHPCPLPLSRSSGDKRSHGAIARPSSLILVHFSPLDDTSRLCRSFSTLPSPQSCSPTSPQCLSHISPDFLASSPFEFLSRVLGKSAPWPLSFGRVFHAELTAKPLRFSSFHYPSCYYPRRRSSS